MAATVFATGRGERLSRSPERWPTAAPVEWGRWIAAAVLLATCGCARREEAESKSQAASEFRERRINGKVVLGSERLTAGIPGRGNLTIADIKSWLNDAENHRPLEFTVPLPFRNSPGLLFVPEDNPLTRAKIELGRQLFFDKRLGAMSCSDCHQPRQAFAANQFFPDTGLSPLPSFNRIFSRHQFWNGKAKSLEDQPRFPVTNRFEMETTPAKLVEAVKRVEGYRLQFDKIFGAVHFEAVCQALACFQRALVTEPSPYDAHALTAKPAARSQQRTPSEALEWRRIEHLAKSKPLSRSALRGAELFFGERTGCSHCHSGPRFSDEEFHNLGVGWSRPNPGLGRYLVTKRKEDKGAIKTPTLRNVARTPPYMHDGSLASLEEVIQFFDRGGSPNPHLSSLIKPLNLTADEKLDLIEFLKSLNSPLPNVETGRLPP